MICTFRQELSEKRGGVQYNVTGAEVRKGDVSPVAADADHVGPRRFSQSGRRFPRPEGNEWPVCSATNDVRMKKELRIATDLHTI